MDADAYTQVRRYLSRVGRRRRVGDALLWAPRGVLVALLVALFVAAIARARPLLTNGEVALLTLALALAGLLLPLLVVFVRRETLLAQARFADRRFGLEERASTAVEIHEGVIAAPGAWAEQQLADTAAAVARTDVNRDLPLEVRRYEWLTIFVFLLFLLGNAFLANPQGGVLQRQRAVAGAIDAQAEELETLAQEIRDDPTLSEEEREQLLQPLEEGMQALQDAGSEPEAAEAALAQAEAEMRALQNELRADLLQEALSQAGASLAGHAPSEALADALQAGNPAQAATAASALSQALDSLGAEEQQQLADDLAQAAEALQGSDPELAQEMADAAAALAEEDTPAAADALAAASDTLSERGTETAAAQSAAQAAENAAAQLSAGRQAIAEANQTDAAGNDATGARANSSEQGAQSGGQQAGGQQSGTGESAAEALGQSNAASNSGGVGGPGQDGGSAESVFVPPAADLSNVEGVDVELPAECRDNPAACETQPQERPRPFDDAGSSVPYTDVFGNYRDAANEALESDYVPQGLKGLVRDYFSSLEPEE